jgi:hypothetical protein
LFFRIVAIVMALTPSDFVPPLEKSTSARHWQSMSDRRHDPTPGRPSGLDDPDYARFAWARFRDLMAWMIAAAMACSVVTIMVMAHIQGPLRVVTMLAILGGVGGSVIMAGALMGLVFLSSGSGHDEDVERID